MRSRACFYRHRRLAQSLITGALTGTVTDPSGAVIPGASVLLKNAGTGASQERTTDAQGWYRFALLAPGSYTVTANAANFTDSVGLRECRSDRSTWWIFGYRCRRRWCPSTCTKQWCIQTDNANLSPNVSAHPLSTVPNSGNDMTFYALISPGVEMSTNGGLFGNFSTFGLPATSNTFTVNGAVNNDVYF